MNKQKYPYLERHKYSPEQNTLHMSPYKKVRVGFFDMIYEPTLEQAIEYAKRTKLI